jgi:NAD(P)-dependent dehydrogenase (short-subunit alcohol dehydrogenase family)
MNQPLLDGRVAIITGAGRGIGAATAKAFVAAGAAVALAARDAAALQALADELTADGGRAIAVPTAVGDPASIQHLVEQTVDAFGRLDLAFNNAAGGGQGPTLLADLPVEAFDSAIAISLRGVFLSMKYEIPAMLAVGGGAIVNMSSTAVLRASAGWPGTSRPSTASSASPGRRRSIMRIATCVSTPSHRDLFSPNVSRPQG